MRMPFPTDASGTAAPSKEFPEGQIRLVYLDWDRSTQNPARRDRSAAAVPGHSILGVARAEPGRYSTVPPGRYAGNLDLRERSVT